ncbi:hypothetical protein ACFLT9_08720 [Acidobacteriota bacterium]
MKSELNPMKNRPPVILTIACLFWLTLSPLHSNGFTAENDSVFLLFILDIDDFMCHTCLFSLVDFLQQIPPSFREDNIRGILVESRMGKRSREETRRIMSKQLRGFIKTHSIKFPVSVDGDSLFQSMIEEGSVVLLFSGRTKPIRRFPFPLNSAAVDTILSLLLKYEGNPVCLPSVP